MRATKSVVTPQREPLVVLTGPTGVGKTAAAIDLALRIGGEVANADSRYLYRGFDIGVAKPSLAERSRVPHHLIDILPADGDMSLATFQALASDTIRDVQRRGRVPLLVGGTVLYINAIVEGWVIPQVPPDPVFRAEGEANIATDGGAQLRAELMTVDPVAAERSGVNMRRVIRALEIYRATGTPMSELESRGAPPFRALQLALDVPRDILYERLDRRLDRLLEAGLVDEVGGLLAAGVPETAAAMSSIGYRQLIGYLRGEESYEDAVARIRSDTRRYVRHQQTWLRRNPRLVTIDMTDPAHGTTIERLVERFLAQDAS